MDHTPVSDIEKFIRRHSGGRGYVWLVEVRSHDDTMKNAIFSTHAKATEWLRNQPPYESSVCAPFVVDIPEYGNVVPN